VVLEFAVIVLKWVTEDFKEMLDDDLDFLLASPVTGSHDLGAETLFEFSLINPNPNCWKACWCRVNRADISYLSCIRIVHIRQVD
jgi:hypothetical protein